MRSLLTLFGFLPTVEPRRASIVDYRHMFFLDRYLSALLTAIIMITLNTISPKNMRDINVSYKTGDGSRFIGSTTAKSITDMREPQRILSRCALRRNVRNGILGTESTGAAIYEEALRSFMRVPFRCFILLLF